MGGLWENYSIDEVATPEGWQKNPQLVLEFYNQRRKQLMDAKPNAGHLGLVELEKHFNVSIITQNVDNLHERAGSSQVLHLHGELMKVRSTLDPSLVYTVDHWEVKWGDTCEKGSQLRPHIVWFGEAVPAMDQAIGIASMADIFVVIGTSLNVYPAAGLIHYAPKDAPVYLIDPGQPAYSPSKHITHIKEPATSGVQILIEKLISKN